MNNILWTNRAIYVHQSETIISNFNAQQLNNIIHVIVLFFDNTSIEVIQPICGTFSTPYTNRFTFSLGYSVVYLVTSVMQLFGSILNGCKYTRQY